MTYAERVKTGAIVLTLCISLINAADHARRVRVTPSSVGNDIVSLSEKRFSELRVMLPASGSVGYVSDVMLRIGPIHYRDELSDEKTEMEYALTQYALSPLIVDVKTEGHALVVGNFRDEGKSGPIAAAKGLKLIKDFGNGIMLFSRAN